MGVNLSKVEKKAKNYSHVLLVMRHAKAEPFNDKGDHDREITDKGEKQAKIVAKGLVGMKLLPDRVACSGAVRARQTLERMLKVFGDHPKVEYRQALYDGGMQAVFDELANAKDKTRVLMVLGHEPTVSVSCQWLPSPRIRTWSSWICSTWACPPPPWWCSAPISRSAAGRYTTPSCSPCSVPRTSTRDDTFLPAGLSRER